MTETMRCDRCGEEITEEAAEQGWPVPVHAEDDSDGQRHDYICPDCYGDEAYCSCGAVLSSRVEETECAECRGSDESGETG